MTTYCTHHPQEPSHWKCPFCGGDFCNACVKATGYTRYTTYHRVNLCPRCNREMEWVGAKNAIAPYWERLPQFFLYPLVPKILIFLVVLGIINSLATYMGLAGSIIQFLTYATILRYAYQTLVATTKGDLSPPPLGGVPLGSSIVIVLKQSLVIFLLAFPYGFALELLGPTAANGVLFLLLLCVPAIVILLVTSNRVFHAVNPNAFIRLAFRIGKGYLGMFALLAILWGAPALLMERLVPHLPLWSLGFLTCLLSGYYTLVSYNLMGYVTLQYHEQIGYDVEIEDFKAARAPGNPVPPTPPEDPHLRQVTFLLRDGQLEDALIYLRDLKENKADDLPTPELSEKYFALLQMLGHTDEMVAHAHHHLKNLIGRNKKEDALAAYSACVEQDPAFVPTAHTLYHIGLWTSDKESPEKAISIFQKAVNSYPDDPMVPTIWFRAARILNDRLHQHDKAMKLLRGIQKKFPDHEVIPQVQNYMSTL